MSTISAVGSASSAWADFSSSRASAMKDKMFSKVDSDGNGKVDKTELQGLLDKVTEMSGNSLGTAEDLFSKMDSNGDGSLSKDELDAGMKSLMPPPSSTIDFAQQRVADSSREAGAPPGPPPAEGADGSGTSASTDPLDTNGDGTVSAQERAAGELQNLMKNLMSAIDTDGDKTVSKTEAAAFKSQLATAFDSAIASMRAGSSSAATSSGQTGTDLTSPAKLVLQAYSKVAANASQTSALSLAA